MALDVGSTTCHQFVSVKHLLFQPIKIRAAWSDKVASCQVGRNGEAAFDIKVEDGKIVEINLGAACEI